MLSFVTCRFCEQIVDACPLRYGKRSYAHLRCLHKAYTREAFENVLWRIPVWQLENIRAIDAQALDITRLLERICSIRRQNLLESYRKDGWRPGAIVKHPKTGADMELVSFPWLECGSVLVNARLTPKDPTTM
ncbi:MAG: hypothetical protein HRJ53_02985, partial [Acidobacteria bacterium Pan2503]|nr:hypothetical protein [Candidatus Acidoferrum panamensis]